MKKISILLSSLLVMSLALTSCTGSNENLQGRFSTVSPVSESMVDTSHIADLSLGESCERSTLDRDELGDWIEEVDSDGVDCPYFLSGNIEDGDGGTIISVALNCLDEDFETYLSGDLGQIECFQEVADVEHTFRIIVESDDIDAYYQVETENTYVLYHLEDDTVSVQMLED